MASSKETGKDTKNERDNGEIAGRHGDPFAGKIVEDPNIIGPATGR